MNLVKSFFIAVFVNFVQGNLNRTGENVCIETETYNHQENVSKYIPVKYDVVEWCMSITQFFRCRRNKTTWKTIYVPKNFTRVRAVPKCCKGYEEKIMAATICVPVCADNCGAGNCTAPNTCDCPSGFYGTSCQKLCPKKFWGKNCSEECNCLNDSDCDKVSGACTCGPGWHGDRCELPCPRGYYGHSCYIACNCESCNRITGECITTSTTTTETTTFSTEIPTTETPPTEESLNEETSNSERFTTLETTTPYDILKLETTESSSSITITDTSEILRFFTEAIETEEIFEKKVNNLLENEVKILGVSETTSSFTVTESEECVTETDILYEVKKPNIKNEVTGTNNKVNDILAESDIKIGGESIPNSSSKNFEMIYFFLSFVICVLIVLTVGGWLIMNQRKKVKSIQKEKKEKFLYYEAQKKECNDIFTVSYLVDSITYLPDVEIDKPVMVLKTFKPLEAEVNQQNNSTEKIISPKLI